MSSISRKELAQKLSDKLKAQGFMDTDVQTAFDAIVMIQTEIKNTLCVDGVCTVRGFGQFYVSQRDRLSHNPRTLESLGVNREITPRFKPSKMQVKVAKV
jgi:nucleoid DNA-binding protein